ncbi:hypothetical protein A3A79_00185 [Candidatus Gottesmanbacteria bacterium RIFCSPLOWO2_01_FULL_43_11b]|uniref:Uncharacterized protein n=1 Tax=Candidatus Gottesmanbacteria bacterium RIFCSPLOWO2_01_FULL_43_11b TaxID=1798392 RepID=A0A1F6AG24_9BACT|nr:MAG: hypothetical protein A3A79_00185 [Candidatus Gottesmanbacteria bacterium RIFCSPLOWO2_01_FULL_43_11b]
MNTTKNLQSITDFPQFNTVEPPRDRLPQIKVNGVARISSRILDRGFEVKINNKTIRLRYPPTIWQRFPKSHQKVLAQNIAYAMTFQIPYLYTSLDKVFYNMPVPLAEPFLFKGLSLALPSTAIMQPQKDKRITSNLLRRLFDIEYVFSNTKTEIPSYNRTSFSDQAIMPFTFGKDSLLTYALAQELGVKVWPVYISEPYSPFEEVAKKLLAEPFKKEFHTQIAFLRNTLGVLRQPYGWFGWELQLTQYSLMLLPYVYAKKAGYILFSNEQSCDDTVVDSDGFKCNPVFEQSHSWLLQNSLMASLVGGNSLSIGSLLEPIHEIAIMRILHKRYPEIAKYQSSCDLPEKPKSAGRWCEHCSKCARMYIFLLAHGINPKTVGFKHDLLKQKYLGFYSIFSEGRIQDFGYDQSEAGKNEQILAFRMAYKRGFRGPVMRAFSRHYGAFAKKHERKLRQTFFGIHSTRTIPSDLRPRVLRIYHSILDPLA